MNDLYKVLPDDRPITSICVVADPQKCPVGYTSIIHTYDQDNDADLWKDGFFGRKITRYLCTSKNANPTQLIVESLSITNEKEQPPDGFTLVTLTTDTDEKAWRKRQLCYRLTPITQAINVVTDIIIVNRRNAPDGFLPIGEMNGLLLCYKSAPFSHAKHSSYLTNASDTSTSVPGTPTYQNHNFDPSNGAYAKVMSDMNNRNRSGSVGCVLPLPKRAAPLPPGTTNGNMYNNKTGTLGSGSLGIDGVPFIFSSKLKSGNDLQNFQLPRITPKTMVELDFEYDYDFRMEQQASDAMS